MKTVFSLKLAKEVHIVSRESGVRKVCVCMGGGGGGGGGREKLS